MEMFGIILHQINKFKTFMLITIKPVPMKLYSTISFFTFITSNNNNNN